MSSRARSAGWPGPLAGIAVTLLLAGAWAEVSGFNPADLSLDELMFHASRYGTTPEKRERKQLAKAELMARRGAALRYLVDHAHVKNLWFSVYAQELAEQMTADEAVPVLVELLASPRAEVRKMAAYLLGFFRAPEHAGRLAPLLDEPDTAGAAIRTLGKWRLREAAPRLGAFLQDADERRRVLAANALGDIGDPHAAPALVAALDDPYFTVREAAARALARLGPVAERELARQLRVLSTRARRHAVDVLQARGSRYARHVLRRLLRDPDPRVREDAQRALAPLRSSART